MAPAQQQVQVQANGAIDPITAEVIDRLVTDMEPLFPAMAARAQRNGMPVPKHAEIREEIVARLQGLANAAGPGAQQGMQQAFTAMRDRLRMQLTAPGGLQRLQDLIKDEGAGALFEAIQPIQPGVGPNGRAMPGGRESSQAEMFRRLSTSTVSLT